MLAKKWKDHLAENNMTYREHFMFAIRHGFRCIFAGLYLIIHGVLPCFYQSVGSKLVHKLAKVFENNKQ